MRGAKFFQERQENKSEEVDFVHLVGDRFQSLFIHFVDDGCQSLKGVDGILENVGFSNIFGFDVNRR